MRFEIKESDFVLRSCDSALRSGTEPHTTAEIIKMVRIEGYLSGHAIAYWEKSKDSFDLKFLGNRPFDKSIDRNAFWRLAELGQKILESEIVGVIEREAK